MRLDGFAPVERVGCHVDQHIAQLRLVVALEQHHLVFYQMNVLVKRFPIFICHIYKASILNDQMLGEGGPVNGVQDPLGVAE